MYEIKQGKIVSNNIARYYNRPLYYNGINGYIAAGDYPAFRVLANLQFFGQVIFCSKLNESKIEFPVSYTTTFSPNKVEYNICYSNGSLDVKILPLAKDAGYIIKLIPNGISPILLCGGYQYDGDDKEHIQWAMDITVHKENRDLIIEKFFEENQYEIGNNTIKINPINKDSFTFYFEKSKDIRVCDYSIFNHNKIEDVMSNKSVVYVELDRNISYIGGKINSSEFNFESEYTKALERNKVENKIEFNCDDEKLNLAVKYAEAGFNAVCVDGYFNHGACCWTMQFLGWENIYGAAVLNKQKYIEDYAKDMYIKQVKTKGKESFKKESSHLNTIQSEDSRIYGYGYIDKSQLFYNFQSLEVEQLIYADKYFNSEIIHNNLLKLLPSHEEWQRECFDPDNMGIYESYINTWPTDSIWYNGGRGVEETIFALNVVEYLEKYGDNKEIYKEKKEYIQKALFNYLWIKDEGHFALYLDVKGEKVLHKSPWLYSLFMPINNNGILDKFQSVESLHYTHNNLERKGTPGGGERVCLSNMLPDIWSDRTFSYGEDFQLAEAFFRAGLIEEGLYLFRSAFEESCYYGYVPGNLGTDETAIDFTAITSNFLRCLFNGLIGFNILNQGNKILFKPAFISAFNNLNFDNGIYGITYLKKDNNIKIIFKTSSSEINCQIPIYLSNVGKLLVDGEKQNYTIEKDILTNTLVFTCKGESVVEIELIDNFNIISPKKIDAKIGDKIEGLFIDNEGVLSKNIVVKNGDHALFIDKGNYYDVVFINVKKEREIIDTITGNNVLIDLSSNVNSKIENIYKTKYYEKDDNGIGLGVGNNAFSAWTYTFWNVLPPEIKMDKSQINSGIIKPFETSYAICESTNNCICISQYSNYNKSEKVEINKMARGVYVLCAGATNQMQCFETLVKIHVNYVDGTKEEFDVIHPINFLNLFDFKLWGKDISYDNEKSKYVMKDYVGRNVFIGENLRVNELFIKTDNSKIIANIEFKSILNETVFAVLGITLV